MKRRNFLKLASGVAATRVFPVGLGVAAAAKQAYAASPAYEDVNVVAPSVMPQVINIHMYGGASELAGNLTNIADIEVNSQNSYAGAFGNRILRTQAEAEAADNVNDDDWEITPNGFWRSAGGQHMEDMLATEDLAVYRTIFKQKSPTRSHRESIFMSHKGTTDIENSPGIGSRLALMMMMNESTYASASLADNSNTPVGSLDSLILPFVSFEGDTQTYALDPSYSVPLHLRGLTMDESFNNPYSRGSIGGSEDAIEALKDQRLSQTQGNRDKYSAAWDGFEKRSDMATRMADLETLLEGNDDNGNLSSADLLGVTYPNTTFGRQLEAAITLAIHNPQTLYMAVGTPGLGGWDDHNNGVDDYPGRMNQLMDALKAGMEHIRAAQQQGVTTISGTQRNQTNNIVINVLGDFGRLVNLNGSNGWDHANNQNLYTLGGKGVRPQKESAAMGSVVGTTVREGTSKTNNQYTVPASGSVTFEPMCMASSIYSYFGVQNPGIMTDGDGRLEDALPDLV